MTSKTIPVLKHDDIVLEARNTSVFYGPFQALRDISLQIPRFKITAIIGPSISGKSSLLRCFSRMNDLIPKARVEGQVLFNGLDLYAGGVNPTEIRYRVGMVFQKPTPFPQSVYDNVAFGPRVNGTEGDMDEVVEKALRQAVLWDEVKDRLRKNALTLSGGQQQRLCVARTLAVEPEVILMDEPCASLDPIATLAVEDLMRNLSKAYTIVVVPHNIEQAARVSDKTAFLMLGDDWTGHLVEHSDTSDLFTNPKDQRTEDFITGRIG